MTNIELANALKNEMFGSRETIREAFDYAFDVAEATGDSPAVITALMVVVNTISEQIVKNEG